MKNLNLKLAGTLALSLLTVSTFAQNWKQGGNGAIPAAWDVAIPANQLLGTTTNYPLRIITNNVERMSINENLNYNGGYFSAPGFFGWLTANYPTYTLGAGNKPSGFIGINTDKPQSRLHISGVTTVGPGTGWRPWMQNGVFMNERSNNMYVGMYHLPTASSEDAVMNWGDDGAGTGNRLRVIFTPTTGILPGTQPLHVKDQEMMSFWVNRNVGIGDFINVCN